MVDRDAVLVFQESWKEPGDVLVMALQTSAPPLGEAGQFVQVQLPTERDPRGGKRALTLASAPSEDRVLLATLVEHEGEPSPFKEALEELKPGDKIPITAPAGRFTLQKSDKEATHVVLALGIGATAARSLTAEAANTAPDLRLRVVQTPVNGGYPFEEDLRNLDSLRDAIEYEKVDQVPDVEELKRLAGGDLSKARFYVAGPPEEVTKVRKALLDAGVDRDRLKFEAFAGY